MSQRRTVIRRPPESWAFRVRLKRLIPTAIAITFSLAAHGDANPVFLHETRTTKETATGHWVRVYFAGRIVRTV